MSTGPGPIIAPYATDEDIALRASADFALLCPKDQLVAQGNDGAISQATPWQMDTGANVSGILAGQILQLKATTWPTHHDMAVLMAAEGSITLRRKGQGANTGQPPGGSESLNNLQFRVTTLAPQILLASSDMNHRFGITSGLYPGRTIAELADPTELRDAVVLTVLYRQYLSASREAPAAGEFASKARVAKQDLDDMLARLAIHWRGQQTGAPAAAEGPTTTRFGCRMER